MIDDSWNASVDRREFVRSLASAFAVAAVLRTDAPFKLGILRDSRRSSFDDGISLGLEEASRAASLFGHAVLHVIEGADVKPLMRNGAQAVIGAVEYPDAKEVADSCNAGGAAYMNCRARSNEFRKTCRSLLFHIEASDAMYSDARAKASSSSVVSWDSTLEKYGAAQLNDRFRSASGHSMDGRAWCGWFAVKVVLESVLRAKIQTGKQLGTHLRDDRTQFDGHKGAPLSFRTWDHQLRQPLYALSSRKPPEDIPDISKSANAIRDLLDSIGEKSHSCR